LKQELKEGINYFRLNPDLKKIIDLDDCSAESIFELINIAEDYLKREDVKQMIENIVGYFA
jgi:hypothetical protein